MAMHEASIPSGAPRPFSRRWLEEREFSGFVSFGDLRRNGYSGIPTTGGVYVVLSPGNLVLLEASVGGWFKGRDPTVDVRLLEEKKVPTSEVLYIGKATSLRNRLRQFSNFGLGKPIGHWGGRFVWQCQASQEFLVAWKETRQVSPREAEVALLREFRIAHGGHLPFANLSS